MDKPSNPRLWDMLVVQARAKFRKWPSLPASKWVHEQYLQKGGRFIDAAQEKRIEEVRERGAARMVDSKGANTKKKTAKKDNKS